MASHDVWRVLVSLLVSLYQYKKKINVHFILAATFTNFKILLNLKFCLLYAFLNGTHHILSYLFSHEDDHAVGNWILNMLQLRKQTDVEMIFMYNNIISTHHQHEQLFKKFYHQSQLSLSCGRREISWIGETAMEDLAS